MANFNNAYRKTFLATKATQTASGDRKAVNNGLLITKDVHTGTLKDSVTAELGVGTFGFFDPSTHLSVINADLATLKGKPLYIAGAPLFSNDMIGPFHGGYAESNKSKLINPRYVTKFLKVTGGDAENAIAHVGKTNYAYAKDFEFVDFTTTASLTNGVYTGIPITTVTGTGAGGVATVTVAGGVITKVRLTAYTTNYSVGATVTLPVDATPAPGVITGNADGTANFVVTSACAFDFVCGSNYTLRLDLSGSPVYRVLNHAAYRELTAYTGCCDAPGPLVDSTLVMIDWAKQILADPYLKDFVKPIVYTELGTKLETLDEMNAYVSPGHTTNMLAGLRVIGAYTDDTFSNCSFEKTDFYQKEIVKIKLSFVDLTGNPCAFDGLCIREERAGYGGEGYGETVLRNIILDESLLTNHFHSDKRIQELTQGDQLFDAVNRNLKYDYYAIEHVVPRFDNPSGVFDNDKYMLEFIVPSGASASALETFMGTWLGHAANTVALETYAHTAVTAVAL